MIIKLVRSGTFACYGDMTVTMDKSGSNAEGPIDGKKWQTNNSSTNIAISKHLKRRSAPRVGDILPSQKICIFSCLKTLFVFSDPEEPSCQKL